MRVNRRRFALLGLCLAGPAILAGGFTWLHFLRLRNAAAARDPSIPDLALASDWRLAILVLGVSALVAALILSVPRDFGFAAAFSACLVGAPLLFVGLLIVEVAGPYRIDSVRLPGGRTLILAIEPVLTDAVYTLYEPVDRVGAVWRSVTDLSYSEDGQFTGNDRLVLSQDGRWLVVGRGGIWTDCFAVRGDHLQGCDVPLFGNWYDSGFDRDIRLRSGRIAALTGVKP